MAPETPAEDRPERQPVFLLPGAVTALIAAMVGVHAATVFLLDPAGLWALWHGFGFVPARLEDLRMGIGESAGPLVWGLVTHAFLHADWTHLAVNCAWLAIFGTPVARRYGGGGMLAVFLVGAAAGAVAMGIIYFLGADDFTVLIGASGGVSALTGAAMRFVFQPPLVRRDRETGELVVIGRATASLGETVTGRRSGVFVLFWVGLNLAIPVLPLFGGPEVAIAWQAHIGGFVAGLLMPSLFDARMRGKPAQE